MNQPTRLSAPHQPERQAIMHTRPLPCMATTRALVCGLMVAALLAMWPKPALASDEPVDVPATRGKVDLSGMKPMLGPTSQNDASASSVSTPVPAPRPKVRTVADDIAEAKAKAAAEKRADTSSDTPSDKPPAPTPSGKEADPSAQKGAKPPAQTPAESATQSAAQSATAKANQKPSPNAGPIASQRASSKASQSAAQKAADDGLAKVALKVVEAMAAVQAKQDKQVAPRSQGKKPAAAAPANSHAQAKAAALAGHGSGGHDSAEPGGHGAAHWTYEGDSGPANWAKLKPEFNVCAIGKRQSPIAIDDSATLQGPAEPIAFDYRASGGTVVNNGHTIQVDLTPDNSLVVRGSSYQLLQFHFHHPSEEQVNGKTFSMVAHLVHKNAEGQLAVVAVLLTDGAPNPVIDTVWKHMPLDANDRVPLPSPLLNLNELLPKDQRYYQFMGSLTTPPCTEGVLWMVLKTPVTLSASQIRLFGQLFPNNARPMQGLNGRPVREAL